MENTAVSSTKFESTSDENNKAIQYVEQSIKIETASETLIPRLGYVHKQSYGISINSDFNSDAINSSMVNYTKVYTSQVGSAMIYGVRVTYVYEGGYDFKGNSSHDFDMDVRKVIDLSELFHVYLDTGYFHEQRVISINNEEFAINNRDVFYKMGFFYERSNYKLGVYYKNAYDTGAGLSNLSFRMNTIALYSIFNF